MEIEARKVCNNCGTEKSLSEYYLRRNRNNSARGECKECLANKSKQKRLAEMTPERLEKFLWKQEQTYHLRSGQRKCLNCLEIKPIKDYESSGKKKYSSCSTCRPKLSKEYFERNPHQQVKRHQGVMTNREFVKTYTLPFKEAGCADCNTYYPDAMEFDHTCHPSEKLYNISKIHNIPGTKEKLLNLLATELAKGEYVCVNCHTLRTYSRQTNNGRIAYSLGKDSIYLTPHVLFVYRILSTSNCIDCNESNFLLLEFDHVKGKKTANVSRMMKTPNLYTLEDIKVEIAKCEIRCGNCHRMRTKARRSGMERIVQIPKDKTTGKCECGNSKSREAIICNSCHLARESKRTRNRYGDLDTLINRIQETNFVTVAKELGISDNAIRKHLRKQDIDPKTLLPVKTEDHNENNKN